MLELWHVEDQSLVFITLLSESLTPRKPVSVVLEDNAIWGGTKEPHVFRGTKEVESWKFAWKAAT
jgi:hypothetical protein